MADRIERRSALVSHYRTGEFGAIGPEGPGVLLAERRPAAMLQIAGHHDDAALATAITDAIGLAPPTEPNRSATTDTQSLLWLGPSRWLMVSVANPPEHILEAIDAAIGSAGGAIANVGHARTVLRLTGRQAVDLLAKGCPLDLHPAVFPPGRCANSLFAGIGLLLHAIDDSPGFDLFVARSYAVSFWEIMTEMAEEFGYRVSEPVTA